MDVGRLLRPRSVAVIGASERPSSYGGEALLNMLRVGFPGPLYAVNPGYASVHGVACFASLADLPEVPDAVVVAVAAALTPALVDEAGALGCGAAVVFAAGFAEAGGLALERELAAAARRHDVALCGPNGNGVVCLPARVAMWGDTVIPREPGPVAMVSQSGNVAVNALCSRRGLRMHTVVSCGNGAVIDAADYVTALADEDGVRSIALYLEDDGDGERWCAALERCARAGVGVALLKAGASPAGAAAAQAHTGAIAGDQRAWRALADEAGAAWARDPHELLELAKVMALPGARGHGTRIAVMTCSGGDSAVAADLASDLSVDLATLAPATEERLREVLPAAARATNPLDYTSLLWDEPGALRSLVVALAADPGVDGLLVLFDDAYAAAGDVGGDGVASWAAVLGAIRDGARDSPVPVGVASTLPELLVDEVAAELLADGMPALAGLPAALRAMAALGAQPPSPERLTEIATAARRTGDGVGDGAWLSEHDAKVQLRAAGVPVPPGRLAVSADDAVRIWEELAGPVALKLSHPDLRHKSDVGAVALNLDSEADVRAAFARIYGDGALSCTPECMREHRPHLFTNADVLVEWIAGPGVEVLVAARRDGVVPTLVLALGGVLAELSRDAAVISLPASPGRVKRALRTLGGDRLNRARARPAVDLGAVARIASRVGRLLVDGGYELIELNPVIATEEGAWAVDALACRSLAPTITPAPEKSGISALEDSP